MTDIREAERLPSSLTAQCSLSWKKPERRTRSRAFSLDVLRQRRPSGPHVCSVFLSEEVGRKR